ncbi:MAG TPA: ZIP family metal transporter, partial [Usitatibacter sp.]
VRDDRTGAHGTQSHVHDHGHDGGRTGWMIIFGDSFHNFTDGVIIAGAFLADVKLGVVTATAIIAHEIPQEIGDFVVLLHSGFSRGQALFWNAVSGLAAVAGGVIAYFALSAVSDWIPEILAFAAASMIYVAVADLIPGLHKRTGARDSMIQVVFIALGIGSIWFIHAVLFPDAP